MAPWVRTLFIHMMPRLLLMKRPSHSDLEEELARKLKNALLSPRDSLFFPADASDGKKTTETSDAISFAKGPFKNSGKLIAGHLHSPHVASSGYHGLSPLLDDDIPGLPLSMAPSGPPVVDPEIGLLPHRQRINWTTEKTAPVENPLFAPYQYSPAVQKAIESILYIADHIKKNDDDNNVSKLGHCLDLFTLTHSFSLTGD